LSARRQTMTYRAHKACVRRELHSLIPFHSL
jgi:hypothetical protein